MTQDPDAVTSAAAGAGTGPGARPVDAIADRYTADLAAADPVTATYAGLAGHDAELPDLSPEGFDGREELLRRARDAVRAAAPADERERVAQSSFLERAGVQLEQAEAGTDRWRINVISSMLHEVRGVFDLMPTATAEDWSAIASRLAAVPGALADYRTTLLAEADAGRIGARRQMLEAAKQVSSWTGRTGSGGDVFARLVEGASDVPATLGTDLARNAVAASAAFAAAAEFLEHDLAPRGRETEAVGREQYARDSRYFLGTTVDLDETYAWGWAELERVEGEMAAVAVEIAGAGASIETAVEALESDPGRRIEGRAAFRDWMQEHADRTIAELADVHFDIPEPIRRIECRLAPTNDGGMYYTGPSEDFSRPGRMWWSVPDGVEVFHPWREVTTVHHEGVPGHHLQVAQATYRTELLNRWQRHLCWVSGHGEGWALYAERLMEELGRLDDPGDRLGLLDSQAFRSTRVIIDIGMHLELVIPDNPWGFHVGERWTGALGLEFLRQHARMDEPTLVFEVNRYLGWPAQAPSYKVGERIWRQARDEVRTRQGAAFDLKAFHGAALDLGSLGLDPMREALARL